MMATITIQDTDRDLKKLYDIVTYDQYKLFHDEATIKLDELFRKIAANGDTSTDVLDTTTAKSVRWITGETIEVRGQFSSKDPAKWTIDTVIFTSVDGTVVRLKGNFKSTTDQSAFAAGTVITDMEISSANNLSAFFGVPNVLTSLRSKGSMVFNGTGKFSGTVTTEDRAFEDGWRINVIFEKKFTYADGDYQSTGFGKTLELVGPTGIRVMMFDVSDYDLGAENSDAYDAAYIERFFSGANKIVGTPEGDNISSYDGNDTISSGNGNDIIIAGDGNDSVSAGDGSDLIVGGDGAGNDSYDGGKGIDTVKYTSATAAITVDLAKGSATSIAGKDLAGIGTDKLKGIENLIAGDYGDTLTGSKDANLIEGRGGNDTIDGGLGNDTLVGGAGADRFVFSTKPAANNVDVISDFEVGVDKIVLSVKAFGKLKGLTDLAASFAIGTATGANDYLVYDSSTGRLSYDADGVGKGLAVDIVFVGQGLALSAGDLTLV